MATRKKKRAKYYIGLKKEGRGRVLFKSINKVTESTHGKQFGAVVGPFNSQKEAESKFAQVYLTINK